MDEPLCETCGKPSAADAVAAQQEALKPRAVKEGVVLLAVADAFQPVGDMPAPSSPQLCPMSPLASTASASMTEPQLRKAGDRYQAARKHRDDLIRASTLPLRSIAAAVGLSVEGVRKIKMKAEQ